MTPPICEFSGKVRHPSECAAMRSRRDDRDRGNLQAYFCEDCDAWHLGHSIGSARRRRRIKDRPRRTNRKGFRF